MATIEEIRARWQAATPGPWARCSANDGDCRCGLVWDAEGMAAVAAVQEHNELGEGWTHEQYRANWDAVTAAPTDIATLLAALDAAQRQLALADAVMAVFDGPVSADQELWCEGMAFAVLDYRRARRAAPHGGDQ